MMARHTASLSITPQPLAAVLQYTLSLTPSGPGQVIAQREIAGAQGKRSMCIMAMTRKLSTETGWFLVTSTLRLRAWRKGAF